MAGVVHAPSTITTRCPAVMSAGKNRRPFTRSFARDAARKSSRSNGFPGSVRSMAALIWERQSGHKQRIDEGPRRCRGLVYVLGPLRLSRRRVHERQEMAVLMREDDGFDAAGTALQRGFQTLRDEVEHTVAFGQPAPV